MEIVGHSLVLEENAVVVQDYKEEIIVPSGKTLTIEGNINRLIIVTGGTVVVTGSCNRIVCSNGNVKVEAGGYVTHLYGLESVIEIRGRVNNLFVRDHTTCTLYPDSDCKMMMNQDCNITIYANAHISHYIESGKNCRCDAEEDGCIDRIDVKKTVFY